MMNRFIIYSTLFLSLFMSSVCRAGIGRHDDVNVDTEKYDVYLLIGQSNMAGRGYLNDQDKEETLEGVFLLDSEGKPVPATHPFNQYSTVRKNMSMQRMGPGYAFALKMKEKSEKDILLVVNARGGTSLDEWAVDGELFQEAVIRTRQACRYGRLKGVLWHQGESDSSDEEVSTYLARLSKVVSALRSEFGHVPFIAGEVAQWYSGAPLFNPMIRTINKRIPLSGWVSSKGCSMLIDEKDPHFGREGQMMLGERYAKKMLEIGKSGRKSR